MKKLLSVLSTLAVLSAALCLSAAAAEAVPISAPVEEPAEAPAFVRVWGKVSPWDGEGLLLKNDNQDDPLNEVVIHVGEVPVVDAVTGLPMDLASVKEGDALYAWAGPAMALSLPPQVSALVVVGNIPADAAAPQYYELSSAGWIDPAGGSEIVFRAKNETGAQDLAIPLDAQVTPWLTRQLIRLEGIQAGSRVLVWRDAKGAVSKVLVFPYAYQGVCSWDTLGQGVVDGERVSAPGKVLPGEQTGESVTLLPIRAVAEAAGYEVRWDKNLGAVVSLNGETVFSVQPGADTIQLPGDEEAGLSSPCLKENGVTYLQAQDLCRALNLYFS